MLLKCVHILPFTLEIVEEVLHDVHRIEQQEQRDVIRQRVLDSWPQSTISEFGEKLEVCLVVVCDRNLSDEADLVKSFHNFGKMLSQEAGV